MKKDEDLKKLFIIKAFLNLNIDKIRLSIRGRFLVYED